jgi:hypothetical protein
MVKDASAYTSSPGAMVVELTTIWGGQHPSSTLE